jgi:integrase
MPLPKGQNPNRPKPGSSIKVEPIRTKVAIDHIKKILRDQPRNLCLFTLGINTAFRTGELLSIRLGQVRHLQVGDALDLKQSKTRTYRLVTLNRPSIEAIHYYLRHDPQLRLADDTSYLFYSRFGEVLTVPTVTNLVKRWCQAVGLRGNYGSHTMRKTWGWWQYKRGKPVPLLMEAYGHATQKQTLDYLCIQAEEVAELYDLEL